MTPPAELRARVLAAAAREPAKTRARVRAESAAVLAAGFGGAVVVFALEGGCGSSFGPGMAPVESVAGAAVVTLVALWIGLTRGRSMLGRPARSLVAVTVLTPAVLVVWKAGSSAPSPGLAGGGPSGLDCARTAVFLTIPCFAAALLTRRRTAPAHPRLAGAAIGVASAAFAFCLGELRCSGSEPVHVLGGHLVPLVLSAIAGVSLGGSLVGGDGR